MVEGTVRRFQRTVEGTVYRFQGKVEGMACHLDVDPEKVVCRGRNNQRQVGDWDDPKSTEIHLRKFPNIWRQYL